MKPERNFIDTDDNDETLIRPIPGAGEETLEETMVLPHSDETLLVEQSDPLFEGIPASNPFCTRGSSLLSLVPKLRVQPAHDNVQALRSQLVEEIKEFEALDPEAGISKKQNQVASYFLCALLDETILNTPWGRQNDWHQRSLLFQFHGDGQEGRKFFVILKQLIAKPEQYIHLIELAYLCLSLGYEGVYQKTGNGARAISQYRQKLFDLIQQIKGPDVDILSTNWQGINSVQKSVMPDIPLWVSLVVAGVLLLLIYFGVLYFINRNSDRVAQRLDRLAKKETVLPAVPPITRMPADESIGEDVAAAAALSAAAGGSAQATENFKDDFSPALALEMFKETLVRDIDQKRVAVLPGPVLRITNAFRSGSDQIKEEFFPLLTKIARVLKRVNMRILVVGHTDNQPMFSGRFPSNWHLSEARAQSVASRLAVTEDLKERIRFEGHGAGDPIAANDTEQHRALNRRIDIYIR